MLRQLIVVGFGLATIVDASDATDPRNIRRISQIQNGSDQVDLSIPIPLSSEPEIQYGQPIEEMPLMPSSMELYGNVKYRRLRNIDPCAHPIVVQVPDPCARVDSCCPKPCVNIQICVPECGCPTVRVSRNGNKICYDYGKYAVTIVSAHGRVVVDYDD